MDELSSGKRKTRKPHKCHGCNETIPAGTVTDYWTGAAEGTVYTLYTCTECIEWCEEKKCCECIQDEEAFEGYVSECRRNCE